MYIYIYLYTYIYIYLSLSLSFVSLSLSPFLSLSLLWRYRQQPLLASLMLPNASSARMKHRSDLCPRFVKAMNAPKKVKTLDVLRRCRSMAKEKKIGKETARLVCAIPCVTCCAVADWSETYCL